MNQDRIIRPTFKPAHPWLRKINVTYVPGVGNGNFMEEFTQELLDCFQAYGHQVLDQPNPQTDVILTNAVFGEPLNWRQAYLFTARSKFHLPHSPIVFTLLHCTRAQFQSLLDHFQKALEKNQPDPLDFNFPGLAKNAYLTLFEQGQRGGPILSLLRLLQSQAKCLRIILAVGDTELEEAYTFDMVGAFPRSDATNKAAFYEDLMLRIVTAASTHEITAHQIMGDEIPYEQWQKLTTPAAMKNAGIEFGKRQFFTDMVRIADLVSVPSIADAVANQYSEGCFATWDPDINGLIATITGSARPVEKDNLTEDELAIIAGVRPDRQGALVRHVQGKRNDSPSSEAVEMFLMDLGLPQIEIPRQDKTLTKAPVARSKLHGHRGLRAYNPNQVEYVTLDEPFYYYPVSCSTEAQAQAIHNAFSHSKALQNPQDPRLIVFTVLPGHGIVIAEKWVEGKAPFQIIWELIDDGALQIDNQIPQGPFEYLPAQNGLMVVHL